MRAVILCTNNLIFCSATGTHPNLVAVQKLPRVVKFESVLNNYLFSSIPEILK